MLGIFSEFGLHCCGCGWCDQSLDIMGNRGFNEVMKEAYAKGWSTAHPSAHDSRTIALCPECTAEGLYRQYRFTYCV